MRLIWVLLFVVVVCFVVSLLWPALIARASVPSGQYPLNDSRPLWPATQVLGLYRPMAPESPPPFLRDAKFQCGTSMSCPQGQQTVNLDI